MLTAALIYPHQLFSPHPAVKGAQQVFFIEDPLLFKQYGFHRQKLMLHRASMKRFVAENHPAACYVDAAELKETGDIVHHAIKRKCHAVQVVDPCDDWLLSKLRTACQTSNVTLRVIPDPHFLTSDAEMAAFTANRQKFFFTDFYIRQRQRLGILVNSDGKPRDGKWSFDTENRKKLPATVHPPEPHWPAEDQFVQEARSYVRRHFPNAPGSDETFYYPTSNSEARVWLHQFLEERFSLFGTYEDAISSRNRVLFHSVLTPALNIGLLSPKEIVESALEYENRIPMNSLEGFIRQIIGWREFVRMVYLHRGRKQRTRNFLGNQQSLPATFYTASTGILPVDHVIRSVLESGYCHHIERLMILGNFMLLCDIHPDEVYRWFMELFVDAYDWVMVPNVYGMSQFADGGSMTTKPYISGSAYVKKMSDFPKGEWCSIWDALYWRFIDKHTELIASNPRTSVMVRMKEKLGKKMNEHLRNAETFLTNLHD